jgi:E3 ubiquitin-protein ligase SHPRH
MGLGKTVELLACIFAHRRPISLDFSVFQNKTEMDQIKRQKVERVECICGAASESSAYTGVWVQCDICDAWQHADCVGYSPKRNILFADTTEDVVSTNKKSTMKSGFRRKKKPRCSIVETEDKYICALCLELIEATQTNILSHATLIVCPAPILAQWHSEITRYDLYPNANFTILHIISEYQNQHFSTFPSYTSLYRELETYCVTPWSASSKCCLTI